jgi:hypothetical protein
VSGQAQYVMWPDAALVLGRNLLVWSLITIVWICALLLITSLQGVG